MNTSFSFRTMAIGLLLVALIIAARLTSHYHDKYQRTLQLNAEQEKTLAQQSGLISTLQAQDRKNRALAAEQQQREQQLRQRGEIYQRKLRDALKNDTCGNSRMPDAVLDLLQQSATGTDAGSPVAP